MARNQILLDFQKIERKLIKTIVLDLLSDFFLTTLWIYCKILLPLYLITDWNLNSRNIKYVSKLHVIKNLHIVIYNDTKSRKITYIQRKIYVFIFYLYITISLHISKICNNKPTIVWKFLYQSRCIFTIFSVRALLRIFSVLLYFVQLCYFFDCTGKKILA